MTDHSPRPGTHGPDQPRTHQQLLTQLRWDVYRLAIHTLAPPIPGRTPTRRQITRDPLLSEIRNAIRPDQGGEPGRGGGTGVPFDAAAFELYEDLSGQIASAYETATDRRAHGTPEQLLLEWLTAFTTQQPNLAQLENYTDRIARWRRRLESHFDPPQEREYPLCPRCGYTHVTIQVDGEPIQKRALTLTYWPRTYRALAECRHCGTTWKGSVHAAGVTEGIADLHDELDENVATYGPVDYVPAPTSTSDPRLTA